MLPPARSSQLKGSRDMKEGSFYDEIDEEGLYEGRKGKDCMKEGLII